MKKRIILYADEGKVLTDGNTYGTEIYIADNVDESKFTEITKEEYEEILNEQAEVAGV